MRASGQNGNEPMQGRKEHIDLVTNDGTWHVQLSGQKTWLVRPNLEGHWPAGRVPDVKQWRVTLNAGERNCFLGRRLFAPHNTNFNPPADLSALLNYTSSTAHSSTGDLFMINTKLWFHQVADIKLIHMMHVCCNVCVYDQAIILLYCVCAYVLCLRTPCV